MLLVAGDVFDNSTPSNHALSTAAEKKEAAHAAALKERIGTQIQVIPVSGGRSSLSGHGCR